MRVTTLLLLGALGAATTPAMAEEGDLLVRLRGVAVVPNETSGPVLPAFPVGEVSVDDSIMPEVDFTYMLTDHVGAELILATTKHHVGGEAALDGLGEVASTWVLPPTLTLQYHFAPAAKVRPYVGAGINYTIFYSEDASSSLERAIGSTEVKLDSSFGYAVQAGVDFDLTKTIFANLDVKYIDMDTTATLTTGTSRNRVDVSVDPIVIGVGLGTRF